MKMLNKLVLSTALISSTFLLSSFKSEKKVELVAVPIEAKIVPLEIKKEVKIRSRYKGQLHDYLNAIAKKESNFQIGIVNEFGMMGKYQFSKSTLRQFGITEFDNFLSNEVLQDSTMILNLKTNSAALGRTIRKYSNTWIKINETDSIYVTKSGILAGAHLLGIGGVLSFFYPEKYNHPLEDGNGTTVIKYMKLFGNYHLEGI